MPKNNPDRNHRGPLSRAGTAYVRTRTATACQVCRARRAKCDSERPCSNCRRIGATCLSEPASTTAGFDPASLAILAKLQELQGEVQALSQSARAPPAPASVDYNIDTASTSTVAPLDTHLQRGNIDQVLAWDIWKPHQAPAELEASGPGRVTESSSLSGNAGTGSESSLDLSLFSGYLDDFFRNVHVLNPVLDEQQTRSQLTQFLLSGVGWDAASCLLLLILANGARSSTFDSHSVSGSHDPRSEQRWTSAQALFEAAEKRKDTLRRSNYLTEARCHFYSGVFMMISMQPFEAWRFFLQGLATCQRLTSPSHRRRPRNSENSEEQAEESIYWSCWKSERELRFELDVPDFTSAAYDHPIMFPTLPQVSHGQELRAWYFYLAEISLWRFEMTARQTMSDLVKQASITIDALAQRVADLDTSMISWQQSLPDSIHLDFGGDVGATDVLLFVLRGRLTYNYEVLTWPFLETLILFGKQNGIEATELAAKGVRMHYDRLSINRPGFYYLHHGTWLMQRSSARSACVLLAVARSSSASLLPTDWLDLVWDTVSMLEYWNTSDNELTGFMRSILVDLAR